MSSLLKKPIFWIIVILLLLGIVSINRCADNMKADVVQDHKDNLTSILNIDSIKTVEALKVRALYEDSIQDLKARKDSIRIKYKYLSAKDNSLEQEYRDKPSLELCDSVIVSKNTRIATLEQLDSLNVKTIILQQGIIANSDRLLKSKDTTIHQLGKGYQDAIKDLEKAIKPRRIVVSAGVGYGLTGDGKLQPNAGVQIGYKLFQF